MGLLTGTNSPRYSQYTVDQYTGNGSQTLYILSKTPPSSSSIIVTIDGVKQHSNTYGVTGGSQLTFSEAPPSGSAIEVVHIASQGTAFIPSDNSITTIKVANGAITSSKIDVGNSDGTGAAMMPTGTTEQRPAVPSFGMFRANSTNGTPEWWDPGSSSWVRFSDIKPYQIDYIIVAGGGGGGGSEGSNGYGGGGGGGGAGGIIYGSLNIVPQTSYSFIVGGGGGKGSNGFPSGSTTGGNGSNSSAFGFTAIGGGGGASDEYAAAGSGGSGGGQGGDGSTYAVGSATSGQGYPGGNLDSRTGGGGGGATQAGNTNGKARGGNGYTWLNGSVYGGGGGGGGGNIWTTNAAGGTGGGGQGGATNGTANSGQGWGGETDGAANTGGGGGGAAAGRSTDGRGAGGSGVIIIRYSGAQRALGGSVSSSGGYTYHTFTSSSTFTS